MSIPLSHDLMTIQEAADYLRVKPATMRKWAREETGPPQYRAGGIILYRLSEIDKWVTDNQKGKTY